MNCTQRHPHYSNQSSTKSSTSDISGWQFDLPHVSRYIPTTRTSYINCISTGSWQRADEARRSKGRFGKPGGFGNAGLQLRRQGPWY